MSCGRGVSVLWEEGAWARCQVLGDREHTIEPMGRGGDTPPSLRLGLMYVKGLRAEAGQAIVRERERSAFRDIGDLARRVPELRKDEINKLAEVGALNSLEAAHRRDALWQAGHAAQPAGPLLET